MLVDGDLVSIDCGAIVDGWHGDAAITVVVGEAAPEDLALLESLRRRCGTASRPLQVGGRLYDMGARRRGPTSGLAADASYGIVEEYVGHGIGTRDAQGPAGAQLPGAQPRAQDRRRPVRGRRADADRRLAD